MTEASGARRNRADSSDTRQHLLDAVRRCVRDKGLAATTSRDITAMAGANLAAITYHFGSKDELVAAALFQEIERRVLPALDLLDGADDPAQRMLLVVQELLAQFESARKDTPVYLEALLLASRDGRYRRTALKTYRAIGRRLTDLVADLQAEGLIAPWVDPPAMASLILSVANGVALQAVLDPTGVGVDAMAGQFAGLLLSARAEA